MRFFNIKLPHYRMLQVILWPRACLLKWGIYRPSGAFPLVFRWLILWPLEFRYWPHAPKEPR